MRHRDAKRLPESFKYTIAHRPRVTKRLYLELSEQGGLVVVAPVHWSKSNISETLARNIPRVERFLARARRRQMQPLLFVQGELHFYLGTRYPLTIHLVRGFKTTVFFTGNEIRIDIGKNSNRDVQTALQGWYLLQAKKVFSERLQLIAERTAWGRAQPIPLKLRRMKRSWGNCSSMGVIKLNTHLVKAPLPLVDSVIAHELCHLVEMNHGKAFYELLERLNPNWRKDRARLRSEGHQYLE